MKKLQTIRTVDLAAAELRRAVLSGELAPGSRLPPERSLAETLGISRLTLRAAIAALESEGLLQARQGSGVVVLDYRRTAGVAVLPHLIDTGRMELLGPFLELRRAVAVEAVAVACVRATDADLDRLQVMADGLAVESDLEALATGNLAFGRAVLELADNLPMELLFNTVTEVYQARPELRRVLHTNADAVRASFGAVVALIRTRDPDLARTRVREVLEVIDATTLQQIEEAA